MLSIWLKKLPENRTKGSEIEILEKLATTYLALGDGIARIQLFEVLAARADHDGLIDVEVRALLDMAFHCRGAVLSVPWKSWNGRFGSVRLGRSLLRARNACALFCLRTVAGWNPQDAEEFTSITEISQVQNDRRTLPLVCPTVAS